MTDRWAHMSAWRVSHSISLIPSIQFQVKTAKVSILYWKLWNVKIQIESNNGSSRCSKCPISEIIIGSNYISIDEKILYIIDSDEYQRMAAECNMMPFTNDPWRLSSAVQQEESREWTFNLTFVGNSDLIRRSKVNACSAMTVKTMLVALLKNYFPSTQTCLKLTWSTCFRLMSLDHPCALNFLLTVDKLLYI